MTKNHSKFLPSPVRNSVELEEIVKSSIEGKQTSYYLFVSEWDAVSQNLLDILSKNIMDTAVENTILNVVDIFDVPNGFGSIRSVIQEHKETIDTSPLRSYPQLPALVVLHKAFPRVVSYNGSIFAELGA